ncbi:MAG: DUF1971 domain-containing protein [Vicinamibacterales bacterium]
MLTLPAGLVPVRRTPEFDAETTPAGLRRDHRTSPGVWGRLVVVEGSVRYSLFGPSPAAWTVTPAEPGIIPPGVPHQVIPDTGARFYVEFLREAPETEGA